MPMFSARSRITIGLSCLLLTVLCAAMMLGLTPETSSAVLAGRAALCETIAVCASDYMGRGELPRLERFLAFVIERNPSITSAGVRRADGQLLARIGPHEERWLADAEARSTETQVQVPVRAGAQRWGNVELSFRPLTLPGLRGWFNQTSVRLTLFVTAASYLCFLFYMGRMLAHLDPSRAVPKRVRAALDTLAEGLLVLDNQGRIVLANQSLATWVGRDPDKLIGVPASALAWVSPTTEEPLQDYPWMEALRAERPQAGIVLGLSQRGEPLRVLQANASPVLGHDGHYRGVLVSFGDVTQLEETKRDLSEARRSADEANQAKSEFLARMSHEIRTPMNAILGYTDLLRRGFDESPQERRQYLETVHASGEHLLSLINDILDLSKIEASRMQLELARHSPHKILQEVVRVLFMKAEEKGISLELSCDEPLPQTIQTDAVRLRQVLINLVGNAIKFTERGGVRIVARRTDGGRMLVFDVIDTGIGISAEGQKSVFDPFSQADTSITRRFGGTGLGLAISRQLARAMGGDVTLVSALGKGSTFTVTIDPGPLAGVPLVTEYESIEDTPRESASKPTQQLRPARVLVADDGEANRSLVQLVLRRAGLTVVTVENGQQAVDQARDNDFDLILMDMQMPVMDGYTATTRLRQSGYTRPILALTAHAMQGDEEKCRDAGCSGFMTKPISIDRLLATLAEIVGTAEMVGTAEPATTQIAEGRTSAERPAPADPAGPIHSTLPTDDADFREIVEQFRMRLGEKLAEMRQACIAGNYAQLAADAHWLKGCGGSAGFDEFTNPARALEQLAKQHNGELASLVLDDLCGLADRIELPWRAPRAVP